MFDHGKVESVEVVEQDVVNYEEGCKLIVVVEDDWRLEIGEIGDLMVSC